MMQQPLPLKEDCGCVYGYKQIEIDTMKKKYTRWQRTKTIRCKKHPRFRGTNK